MKHINVISRRPNPAQNLLLLPIFGLISDILSLVIIPLVIFKEESNEPEDKTFIDPGGGGGDL